MNLGVLPKQGQNKEMRFLVVVFIALSFFLPALSMAQTQHDFEAEKKRAEKRYKNFYSYARKKRQKRVEIEALAEVSKKRRKKRVVRQEKNRKKFVQQRQAKPSTLAAEKKHEIKIKKRAQKQTRHRTAFANQQKILKKFRESVVKIPQDQEVGLKEIK